MPPNTTVAIETALMAEMYDVKARSAFRLQLQVAKTSGTYQREPKGF